MSRWRPAGTGNVKADLEEPCSLHREGAGGEAPDPFSQGGLAPCPATNQPVPLPSTLGQWHADGSLLVAACAAVVRSIILII